MIFSINTWYFSIAAYPHKRYILKYSIYYKTYFNIVVDVQISLLIFCLYQTLKLNIIFPRPFFWIIFCGGIVMLKKNNYLEKKYI